jgi:hypothetical protein
VKKKPYVHSNYERKADDDYKTIDPRCVDALIQSIPQIRGRLLDCCSPSGSGIVNRLKELGYNAGGLSNAFLPSDGIDWIISNPPYKRRLVDQIIWHQINRIDLERVYGVAMLLRNNFDFAKTRWTMFNNLYYYGQIHMMFRPWWVEKQESTPIHNFVWHIWTAAPKQHPPSVFYWRES